MKHWLTIKRVVACICLVAGPSASFAQAKLNITGAKVNMAAGTFLSTNDVSVSTSTLTVAASTLKVANSITSSDAIDVSAGTLEMNGAAAQQIPANSLTGNVIKNLTISGNADVTVAGPLALTDVLTLSSGSLTSGGMLTLKSTSANTARVAPITTNATVPVNGNVVVERYITSKRAYRFLTAPVNTPGNIRANWMENTNNPNLAINNNPVPGYGTHITGVGGNANGFDVTYTNNPSMFTYDNQAQTWGAVTNTNNTLNAGAPYRLMVRGDRSTDITQAAPPSSITTLRATGTLATRTIVMAKPGGGGTAGMPELSNTVGGYSFVGNPYASPIDWLLLERTNLSGTLYIWDATLSGATGRGEYVSYNSSTGVNNIASSIDNNLQSGQAFFVQTTAANPVLTFRETHKSTQHRIVFRNGNELPHLSVQLLLPGQDTAGGAADGLAAYFAADFDTAIADEDSYKFSNVDENIAIVHNNSLLSIEGRQPLKAVDTIPMKIWQIYGKSYTIKTVLTKFGQDVDSYLDDSYLNTTTLLKNNDTTFIPVTMTADPLSFAANRFRLVFRTATTLPVKLSSVKAYVKNEGVQVDWTAESESGIEKYEIEKSTDAQVFVVAGTVKAKGSGLTSLYSWFDEAPYNGDSYYRIRSVSQTGEIKYSAVVKVHISRKAEAASVYASADVKNSIRVQLNNIEKGEYGVNLINSAGQKLYSGHLSHAGGSASNVITINAVIPGGIYHLQVIAGNKNYNASVIMP